MGNPSRIPPPAPPVVTEHAVKVRLTADEYNKLESQAQGATFAPSERTTAEQMIFAAGVEHCLRIVRRGWVMGM